MRPVNLIPADQRRSSRAPVRTGPIAYLLVGALALGLGAVLLLVLTNNKIADHRAEIASLQQQQTAAAARAQQLAPFTNFASMQQGRQTTVESLADSRFDWERVMRELSHVIPSDVWLTHLVGSATATSSSDTSTSSGPTGPTLQITGCGASQDAVAAFLSSLRDIDGVTRVGLTRSEKGEESAGASGGAATSDAAGAQGGTEDCRTRPFIPQFEIVVAFDNAPAPQSATTPATPAAPTTAPPATTTPASTTTTTPTTPAPAPTDTGTETASTPVP